jgi:DNA invertase Pin-like site-specific DNA recombinase
LANAAVKAKRAANPDMDAAELKKLKFIELANARLRVGARKEQIEISDREWAAIQAGAISTKKLSDILDNAKLDEIKERAMPKTHEKVTPAMHDRAVSMLASGYSQSAVAAQLGVSLSTLKRELKADESSA